MLSGAPNSVTASNGGQNLVLTGTAGYNGGGEVGSAMSLGTGSVTKSGPGTWTLDVANSYGGGTNVNAGLLYVANSGGLGTGPVNVSGGTLDATINGLALSNTLTVGAQGTLNLQIGNLVTTTSAASLNGALNLFNLGSLNSGTTELMAYSSYSGNFSSYTTLPTGYSLVYNPGQLDIVHSAGAFSGQGTWVGTTASWNTSGNWTDGVNTGVPGDGTRPAGRDTATFSGSGTVAGSITLDINPSLAALSFSGTNYTLTGGSLTLSSSTGTASVTVTGGTQTIASTVVLASSADFAPALGTQLTLSGNISDGGQNLPLAMTGPGTLILSGTANSYSGGTEVMQGTLYVRDTGAITDGSSLVVGAGGTFIFDPTVGGAALANVSSPASQVGVVPEPGTLVLLLAALGSAAIYRRLRRRQGLGVR